MANGIFGSRLGPQLTPSVDPMQSIQQNQPQMPPQVAQGLQYGMVPGTMMPGQQAPAQGYGQSPAAQQLQNIYGIMAQGARDPVSVGQNYISAMQQQQRLDAANSPMGRLQQIYGKINPHDWSAESLQKFHNNLQQTGQMQFDLLEKKKRLSSAAEKQLIQYQQDAQAAHTDSMELGDLANRIEAEVRAGTWRQGLVGKLRGLYNRHITGEYDSDDAIKQDLRAKFNKLTIDNLPPGVASDRDIAIARSGFPPDTADGVYLAAYVRGIQKMKILEQEFSRHGAQWISATDGVKGQYGDWQSNGYERARRVLAQNGFDIVQVPEGMTALEMARRDFTRGGMDTAARTNQIQGQGPGYIAPAPAPAAPAAPQTQEQRRNLRTRAMQYLQQGG